jgi:broad specificity phosphatase PhoE
LSGRSDIPLNARGRAEARQLAARLANMEIGSVQSSPRARAVETAEIIAAMAGVRVEVIPALDEIDFGAWAGRDFVTLADDPSWHRWNNSRATASTPGGETMAEAIARAVAHLELLAADRPVVCVTHCDIIRGIVAHHLGLSVDRMLGFDCDPASVTTLIRSETGTRIAAVNERWGRPSRSVALRMHRRSISPRSDRTRAED